MNLHALAGASPSSWCVCQFRHLGRWFGAGSNLPATGVPRPGWAGRAATARWRGRLYAHALSLPARGFGSSSAGRANTSSKGSASYLALSHIYYDGPSRSILDTARPVLVAWGAAVRGENGCRRARPKEKRRGWRRAVHGRAILGRGSGPAGKRRDYGAAVFAVWKAVATARGPRGCNTSGSGSRGWRTISADSRRRSGEAGRSTRYSCSSVARARTHCW